MAGVQREQRAAPRVLLVDAHPDVATSTAMLLRLWGFEVRTAGDSAQALAETLNYRPDILVTEVLLPDGDGYALSNRIRELPGLERILSVALTGLGREVDRRRSEVEAFACHLVKPVDPCQLRDILQTLGDKRQRPRVQVTGEDGNDECALLRFDAAHSWLDDRIVMLRQINTRSVALRMRSDALLEKSRALRKSNSRLHLIGDHAIRVYSLAH